MAERESLRTSTWSLELEALLVRLRDETILTISRNAGVATAVGSTLVLLLLPESWLPVEFSQRMLALSAQVMI